MPKSTAHRDKMFLFKVMSSESIIFLCLVVMSLRSGIRWNTERLITRVARDRYEALRFYYSYKRNDVETTRYNCNFHCYVLLTELRGRCGAASGRGEPTTGPTVGSIWMHIWCHITLPGRHNNSMTRRSHLLADLQRNLRNVLIALSASVSSLALHVFITIDATTGSTE